MKTYMKWCCGTVGAALAFAPAWSSEPACYESAAAAAAQKGMRSAQGFRIGSTYRDSLTGDLWANIRSCGHPERPQFLVLAALGNLGLGLASSMAKRNEASAGRALVMLAGSRVNVVEVSEGTRIEIPAVAQTSGAIGDRMRARIIPLSSLASGDALAAWTSNERVVTGVVKSSNVLEVDPR